MRVTLIRRTKIWHNAGETVEVSPVEAENLVRIGSAEKTRPAEKKKPARK